MKTFLYLLVVGVLGLLPWCVVDLIYVTRPSTRPSLSTGWLLFPIPAVFPASFYFVLRARLRLDDRVARNFCAVVGAIAATAVWVPVAFVLAMKFHFAIGGTK